MFNVSLNIVQDIDKRKSWKEIIHPNEKDYIQQTTKKSTLLATDMTTEDWAAVLAKLQVKSTVNEQDNQYCKSPCWERKSNTKGFCCMSYKGRFKLAHIWAAEYKAGRFIDNSVRESSRHLCGNGLLCINPDHLQLGTATEQSADKRLHGTSGKILTIEKARAIRSDKRSGKDLAAEYSVSTATISDIRMGKIWKE